MPSTNLNESAINLINENQEKTQDKLKKVRKVFFNFLFKKDKKPMCISLKNNKCFHFVQYSALILGLFLDDTRLLFTPRAYDNYVDTFMMILFIFFIFEIIIRIIWHGKKYAFSFLCFIDVLATLTLTFDVVIIYDRYISLLAK